MKYLPDGWAVKPAHAITMGWSAEFTFNNMQFAVAEHKLHLEIFTKKGDQWQSIDVPENASFKELAELLQREAEKMLKR